MKRFRIATLIAALSGALIISGCQPITLTDAAVTADDSCSPFRATIAAARKTELDQQAQGAATGALFGALLGAAVSGGDDRVQGALIGALAGGLTGYASVYAKQASARASDSASLLRVVNGDASRESTLVTRTGRAAASLRSCRRAEIAAIAAGVRSGQISGTSARTQVRQVQARAGADNRVISAAFEGIGRRVNAYVDTTNQVASVDRAISSASARRATPSVRRVSSQTQAVLQTEVSSRNRIDAELNALEALLG